MTPPHERSQRVQGATFIGVLAAACAVLAYGVGPFNAVGFLSLTFGLTIAWIASVRRDRLCITRPARWCAVVALAAFICGRFL